MPNVPSPCARANMHPLPDPVAARMEDLEPKIIALQRMVLGLDLARLAQVLVHHRNLLDILPAGPLTAEASALVERLDGLIAEFQSASRRASSAGLRT